METKVCKKCNIEQEISNFTINNANQDKLDIYCKNCKIEIRENNKVRNIFVNENSNKICNICGKEKPLNEFVKDKGVVGGFRNMCKECLNKQRKQWRIDNPEKAKEQYERVYNYQKEHHSSRKHYQNNHLRILLMSRIKHAISNNIPYDDIDSLESCLQFTYDQGKCQCCERELVINSGKDNKDNSFSIDRIIPELGYTIGNVAIICWRCNSIKKDSTPQELYMIADWYQQKINSINTENNSERIDINVSA